MFDMPPFFLIFLMLLIPILLWLFLQFIILMNLLVLSAGMITNNCVNGLAVHEEQLRTYNKAISYEQYFCIFSEFSFVIFDVHVLVHFGLAFTNDVYLVVFLTLHYKSSFAPYDLMLEVVGKLFKPFFFSIDLDACIVEIKNLS